MILETAMRFVYFCGNWRDRQTEQTKYKAKRLKKQHVNYCEPYQNVPASTVYNWTSSFCNANWHFNDPM